MALLELLLLLLLHQTFAALEVFTPSTQRVLNGSSVVLPCAFSINKMSFDPKYLAIVWSFQGKQILVYDNKGMTKSPRVTFNVEGVENGTATLTVANVTLSDGGTYSCLVVYSPERTESNILLEVQVRPTVIFPVRKGSENTLRCQAVGFFPRDIEITWILDGKIPQKSLNRESVKNEDGTYNVTSDLVSTALESKNISCIVNHTSLHEPLQENFRYEAPTGGTSAGIIAACCIIGFMLIFLTAGALWWKRKQKRKGPFIIRGIEAPPKLIDGEEATLYCTVDNCPENLSVNWLIRRAGQDQEIQTSQMREHPKEEEEESLLDTSYVIRSQREGRQYITSLSFIPHIERHRDVTFICRGVSDQHKEEKTFHCKTVYGKPKLSQPLMRSLFISGEVKYLLNLEKFYPKSIKIVWRCGVENTEELLSSTESPSDNPDRTHNISSEVRIPEDRHKDPGFRVRVTWEHDSMDKPESRELSIRDSDYIWTPVVEEIQIPHLLHGSSATLRCNISEYFPDAVTVKWLISPEQSAELNKEIDAVVNQKIISRRESDNTYSCTASLTITPTRETHQGAEYICLVDHPSLEKPIERRTGRLQVYAKPQMSAPIEITMTDSSRVQFSLNLQKFYPKDIRISWKWGNTTECKYVLSAKEEVSTQDGYLTYDVTSVVSIPEHPFNDPEMKIIVMWKHETMEIPETRSLSIRDLPWCPRVGSIKVPKLEDQTKTTMTCDISGYFPDPLSINWFIKKNGNLSALPKESSKTDRTYKISHKEKRQKDKTYSCEASLSFTPIISSYQGSEIICRVDHPSLESPIETSTGPLHIDVKKLSLIEQGLQRMRRTVKSDTNEGIEEAKPVDEDGEAEPVSEDGEAEPVSENGEAKPVGENGEAEPVGENGEAEPVGENGKAKPVSENGEAKPVGENGEAKPVGENGEAKPVDVRRPNIKQGLQLVKLHRDTTSMSLLSSMAAAYGFSRRRAIEYNRGVRRTGNSDTNEGIEEAEPVGEDGEGEPVGEDGEAKPVGEDGESEPVGEDGESEPVGEDGE